MPNSVVKFSDKQFDKVLTLFKKGAPSKFNLDMLFKLIQLLAVLAAGIWTIYTYVTYQRGQQSLSLQQQEISKEQQILTLEQNKLLADTRRNLEEISLKQQEFDLAQKKLLAATQKSAAETSLKQQEFTLAQNRLLAGTQRELAKTSLAQQQFSLEQQRLTSDFDVKRAQYESQLKELQAEAAAQTPYKFDITGDLKKIKLDALGMGDYKLIISVTAQNLSEKPIEVSSAVVEIYLGTLSQSRSNDLALQINTPGTKGPIEWSLAMPTIRYMSIQAHRDLTSPDRVPVTCEYLRDLYRSKPEIGGFAMGRLQRLQMLSGSSEFRITSHRSRWVGYRIVIFTDDCTPEPQARQTRSQGYFELSEIQ